MSFMSPLRWKISLGYLLAIGVIIFLWQDLTHSWATFVAFLSPVFAFITALVTLQFGIVFAAMGAFLIVFLKGFVSLIIAVSKMGVIKGLFLPWVLAGLQWLHRKNDFIQRWARTAYDKGKASATAIFDWWLKQNSIDRLLLLGFLGPLVIAVAFVLLIKKFVYMFISKKAAEQVVQKATAAVVKHFHKIPVIGGVPSMIGRKILALKDLRDQKLAVARNRSISDDDPV